MGREKRREGGRGREVRRESHIARTRRARVEEGEEEEEERAVGKRRVVMHLEHAGTEEGRPKERTMQVERAMTRIDDKVMGAVKYIRWKGRGAKASV